MNINKSNVRTVRNEDGHFECSVILELIREFSIIFIKHGDAYNKTFHDAKEYVCTIKL